VSNSFPFRICSRQVALTFIHSNFFVLPQHFVRRFESSRAIKPRLHATSGFFWNRCILPLVYERSMFTFFLLFNPNRKCGQMSQHNLPIGVELRNSASKKVSRHLTSAVIFLFPLSIFHCRTIMASKNIKPRAQTYSLLSDVQKEYSHATFR